MTTPNYLQPWSVVSPQAMRPQTQCVLMDCLNHLAPVARAQGVA